MKKVVICLLALTGVGLLATLARSFRKDFTC